jgi:hypothetical protein
MLLVMRVLSIVPLNFKVSSWRRVNRFLESGTNVVNPFFFVIGATLVGATVSGVACIQLFREVSHPSPANSS